MKPHNYGIYYVNIDLRHQYGIPSLRCRCSSWRNVPSGEEQGETVPLVHFRISVYFISYQFICYDKSTEKTVGKKLIDGSKK